MGEHRHIGGSPQINQEFDKPHRIGIHSPIPTTGV